MSELNARWGEEAMRLGFTGVPNLLLRINFFAKANKLKTLSASELLVLIAISSYWMNHRRLPCPSIKTISEALGRSGRHTRRIIRSLEAKRYIELKTGTEPGDRRTYYSLKPLVDQLNECAKEIRELIETRVSEPGTTLLEIAHRLGVFSRKD